MGSMQGGRGEEERGRQTKKGVKRGLTGNRGRGEAREMGEWEGSGRRREQRGRNGERRVESGKVGNGAEKATHTQLLNTKSFISCKVTTAVSMMPRVTYVTAKCLRAQQSAHSFGTMYYCPVQTASAQGTRRKGGGGCVEGAVKKEQEA